MIPNQSKIFGENESTIKGNFEKGKGKFKEIFFFSLILHKNENH